MPSAGCQSLTGRSSFACRRAKDLIGKLLVVEPRRRLTAAEALAHPWINKPIGPGPPLTLTQRNMQRTRQPRRRFKVRRRRRAIYQAFSQPQQG